jgi:5-formyltetrahydrofolate cyclo-ligase
LKAPHWGEAETHSHALAAEDVIRRKVKAELRKRLRGLRATTPARACEERSRLIVEQLVAHEVFTSAKSVALFWPMEGRREVDLRAFDEALRARGVAVYYPAIDAESGTMDFKRVDDVADLAEAGYGFAEPRADAPVAQALDVIVVPAVAVDPVGHRIGYGAGFYDRILPRFAPPAVSVAVAYDFQLIAEVPVTDGDVPVDWVITDRRILRAADGS